MQTLSSVIKKKLKRPSRKEQEKSRKRNMAQNVDIHTFAAQLGPNNLVKLKKRVRPVEDVPSIHPIVLEHFLKEDATLSTHVDGYSDHPLGKQVRPVEDVPSIHLIVLKHFQKKT